MHLKTFRSNIKFTGNAATKLLHRFKVVIVKGETAQSINHGILSNLIKLVPIPEQQVAPTFPHRVSLNNKTWMLQL